MLKISDFAEIAQVSISALRYYDEIGLFKPAHIDSTTGYRFYSVDQLVQLNRILALKDLGIDLKQIARLLDEDLSVEAFRGMLRIRQAQLQQTIQLAQEQLTRIEARLEYIERGGCDVVPEVVLKTVKPILAISSYSRVDGFLPNAEYANAFLAMLKDQQLRVDGYIHYVYHRSLVQGATYDIEVAVPIDKLSRDITDIRWDEHVFIHELSEVPKMASTLHRGSPYALMDAYQALGIWIQASGYTITGPCRKVCLRWSGNLTEYLTEIQFPVEPSEQ